MQPAAYGVPPVDVPMLWMNNGQDLAQEAHFDL